MPWHIRRMQRERAQAQTLQVCIHMMHPSAWMPI